MKKFFILAFVLAACQSTVISRHGKSVFGVTGNYKAGQDREVTLDDRLNCTAQGTPDGPQPDNRSNTTVQVNDLISQMTASGFDGYIVVSGDAHQSEYTDPCEERRSYISGFTGSAGVAVILQNGRRAVWSDGRYFLQADEQLGCEWLFMRSGEDGVPTVAEWLSQELSSGSVVAADARMVSANSWLELQDDVSDAGITLVPDQITNGNSILDEIWNADGRPACTNNPTIVHPIEYAGVSWQDKISNIYDEMIANGADVYILTKLDETAWTLNIRGSDIPYNPVFPSYIIIDRTAPVENSVRLFAKDLANKFPTEVLDHLGVGNCAGSSCVSLADYDTIESALITLNADSNVNTILMPYGLSYYIYNLIDTSKHLDMTSPVMLMKAAKNPTESAGMRNAHLKDGVALMRFLHFMEAEIAAGSYWTEVSAYPILDGYRSEQDDFLMLSFNTISAYGSNAAIIHYSPEPETDKQIGTDSLYMLDSGGTYLDGTTDVTRTLFYGDTPDPKMSEAYTRVLMGQINFAIMVFPKGTSKGYVDVVAREPLYSVGWDYRHGTSHGVGMCLLVHEDSDTDFELGFFGSDEPGYYEDGEFGVRLENLITVVEVETKYNFTGESYGFNTVTLVPYEPKLIQYSMLSTAQCNYLNAYNQMVVDKTSAELQAQGLNSVYDWMISKTAQVTCT